MKFYVATSLGNAPAAARVRDLLTQLGHRITFDWMDAPGLHANDPRAKVAADMPADHGSQLDSFSTRAIEDIAGVAEADALIAILPGGIGTHVEIGVALSKTDSATAARHAPLIVLWAPGGLDAYVPEGGYPCVFWHHPGVTLVEGDMADLIATVETWAKNKRR